MRTVAAALGLLSITIAGAAKACPSGTCPVEPTTTAKPPSGQAAQSGQASQTFVPPPSPARDDATSPTLAVQASDTQGGGPYLQKPAFDCSDFQRNDDGGWAAVRAVSFPAPQGPLRVDTGSVYRPGQFAGGYDLGSMLEHDCPR